LTLKYVKKITYKEGIVVNIQNKYVSFDNMCQSNAYACMN